MEEPPDRLERGLQDVKAQVEEMECKGCHKRNERRSMQVCSKCTDGWHPKCHGGNIPPKGSNESWICKDCCKTSAPKEAGGPMEVSRGCMTNSQGNAGAPDNSKSMAAVNVVPEKPDVVDVHESDGTDNVHCPAPNGLVDSLTRYFTPSNKRKTQVSKNSLTPVPDEEAEGQGDVSKQDGRNVKPPKSKSLRPARGIHSRSRKKTLHSGSSKTKSVAKAPQSRSMVPQNAGLKGPLSRIKREYRGAGSNRKRAGANMSLQDGLSAFYQVEGSRKRVAPRRLSPSESFSRPMATAMDSAALVSPASGFPGIKRESRSTESSAHSPGKKNLAGLFDMVGLQMALDKHKMDMSPRVTGATKMTAAPTTSKLIKMPKGNKKPKEAKPVVIPKSQKMSTSVSGPHAGIWFQPADVDKELFKNAQVEAAKVQMKAYKPLEYLPDDKRKKKQQSFPRRISLGKYNIDSWYTSVYPQEYADLDLLYICEYCLCYTRTREALNRHMRKCIWLTPQADEIYRSGDISVFEVDGTTNTIYCQNLCLLAKLFLNHKTLYHDVEPFLFYIFTVHDSTGHHLIGYFSKEKHNQHKYNLSCIITLPPYQRQGYGRLMIAFSYLLSRKEGLPGTPEKPFSKLGALSYKAYWRSAVLEYLSQHDANEITFYEISQALGIIPQDIAETLGELKLLEIHNGVLGISSHVHYIVNQHMTKAKVLAQRAKRVHLDETALQWTPPDRTRRLQEANHQLTNRQIGTVGVDINKNCATSNKGSENSTVNNNEPDVDVTSA